MVMTVITVLPARQQHADIDKNEHVSQQACPPPDTALDDGKVEVLLPDMFRLFLSEPPRVNPHYESLKAESEAWFAEKCHLNARQSHIINRTDFSYFCAVTAPDAGPVELRTMCDWGNWVFPFDDLFDNGILKDDIFETHKVTNIILRDLGFCRDVNSNSLKGRSLTAELIALIEVHQSVWTRIYLSSSLGVQNRFANSMEEYIEGSMEQVSFKSQCRYPSFDEIFAMRRKSAGVTPLFALAEYALKLDLPGEVFESKAIKEIQSIGVDFVVVHNDILSYCKEEAEGVLHNLVAVARYQMESSNSQPPPHPQAAFDRVGALIDDLHKRWFLALADLPSWGEKVDADVQRYIASVKAVVLANLNWSFRSERYFGRDVATVRSKRVVRVLKTLPITPKLRDESRFFPLMNVTVRARRISF